MVDFLSVPGTLWRLYLEYLWDYHSASWVASVAYTFRVLAFLSIAPFVLLTLLDVASYVIARTLGVVDDTKASTSPAAAASSTPAIVIQDSSESESAPEPEPESDTPRGAFLRGALEYDGNLQLAGVGMFSSEPPSPSASRRELGPHMHYPPHDVLEEEGEEGGGGGGQRDASSSGEESFAMLEPESGSEEAAEVTVRRRTRQASLDDADGS
ncbi:hypothetical protein BKA93DRAFT_801602 [Sparassis latifolia]